MEKFFYREQAKMAP